MVALTILWVSGLADKAAYLDPGSGSFLLQLLLAGLLGVAVAVRASWSKIKGIFGKSKPKDQDAEDEEDEK